ncbi:MAG TPA: ParB N-terminal domain-containing protein [Segetibacter sp.]|jgi:hypothetical protein
MQTTTAPTPKINGSVQLKKRPIMENHNEVFKVFVTRDYDKFKIMADNRNINLLHVKRLVNSFNQKHLVSPIIVNEKFEVIDGQHRLRASRETNQPIHYIMIKGYGIKEVQILNTNQKNWLKIDYLHSYCAEGRKEYLEFAEFMKNFPDFGIQVSERILTGLSKKQGKIDGKKAQLKDFEEGKLNIPSLQNAYSVAKKVMDFKPYYEGFNRGTFVSAIISIFKNKKYNHKEMLHKLSVAPLKLSDCPNVEEYKLLIEKIYNYRRPGDDKTSFRYD